MTIPSIQPLRNQQRSTRNLASNPKHTRTYYVPKTYKPVAKSERITHTYLVPASAELLLFTDYLYDVVWTAATADTLIHFCSNRLIPVAQKDLNLLKMSVEVCAGLTQASNEMCYN